MAKAKKFGAFGGVFTPSILTILGVIMYLRLPWIVGQAGLLATLGIILVAHIISGSTGLSVASIATDKRVETGGTYFIISRSLGLPIGGTLGWALFVGLSFSVSLYLIGFAEVFLGYFGFEVNINTIRIAGSIILLLVTILTFISTSLAIKTQYIILTIMVLSLLSVFLGNHEYTPAIPQIDQVPGSLPWIVLFAIFFPAVTGFEAGVSMSGDLKDPRKAIPFGTIMAIVVGLVVYVGLAFFLSFTVQSDLLVNDPNVLFKISWIPQLVIAGILGATLSSALGSILGAPRIMQAVAKDRIAPFFLSKGYGASNEPRNALVLTFLIAQAGILIGDLNVIARIVTIFFIITYGFLNITYTVESWASSDFRPSFKIPRFVSIIGALACIIVMIQLDIAALAAASLVLLALFFFLKNKELTLQTGDTQSSIWLSLVKTGLLKLTKTQTNSRNWRPNVILFSGGAKNRPHLIEIGTALVGKLGIFTNFELIEHPDETLLFDKTAKVSSETIGEYTNIITRKHVCRNIYDGIAMISQVYGFSGFEPNTILMGWAKNTSDPKKMEELIGSFNRLDYNLAFLNYDTGTGFGKHKRIDFWWSGKGRNLALALHLIRFITATPKWRHAEIRILAINTNSKNTEKYYTILGQMLDNYRIRATIKVINNIEKTPDKEIIHAESSETDLSLLELNDFAHYGTETIISKANELTKYLKTSLFIHAASTFEEVNVISLNPVNEIEQSTAHPLTNPAESILKNLHHSKIEIINNKVFHLAQQLEKHTNILIDNLFHTIPESRNNFLLQLTGLTDKISEKLIRANKIEREQEKRWEFLKIGNDFSYHAQKQLEVFRTQYLPGEKDNIQNGFTRFFAETNLSLKSFPPYIRLMFSKEDYQYLSPDSLIKQIKKSGKILWLSITRKKISYKIKTLPAARYYLYYKRLEYFRQFYESYSTQSITAFAELREIITRNYELIENARSGKLSDNEIISEKDNIAAIVDQLIANNQIFIDGQVQQMVDELSSDLNSFSKIIESPQANYLSRRFRSYNKKSVKLDEKLTEFPDLWKHYMADHVNKTYLDALFVALKNRMASKIEKALYDIELNIETNIHANLKLLENQVQTAQEKSAINKKHKDAYCDESIILPKLEDVFNNLIKDIHAAVEGLPESIEIIGSNSSSDINIEELESMDEFVVSVRKTADFYISNELSDQVKKQSVNIRQQLSQSISTIKDLVRLTNFNIDQEKYATDNENNKTAEQKKILTENTLKSIKKEEYKLNDISKKLRDNITTALKRSFEPLSSVIIINTSTNLSKKMRDSEKRRLSNWAKRVKQNISNSAINQMVKVLYSKSEGLLWANRLELSKEKAMLYPGEPVSRMLEKISPNKNLMQKIPFYYANLFSGKPSLSEGFWVGMEEEIEKGSRAAKSFFNGTTGMIIITGERSSGKSSLSKHIANLHFDKQNTFNVRAPKESTADVKHFEQTLYESINGQNSLQYSMDLLPSKSVIIIDDLELWWERKPTGTQVIEQIILLMQQYSHKVLFIVNVNKYALKIINQICSINSWAIDLVFCQPLDARELKDLILFRHQAGGMKFILNRKTESAMTNLDYARLFNQLFNLSSGNPGYTINLWLASIRKVTGNTLVMEKPLEKSITFKENLPKEEILYILQFILHRRFSISTLSTLLQNDFDSTEKVVRILLQKRILIEKFPAVYALNPALEIHLVKKLKSLELL